MVFNRIKKAFSSSEDLEDIGSEYLEIDIAQEEKLEKKIEVRIFVLRDYDDVNKILNTIREGYTIAVVDITNIRKKDPIELKRAITKLKKTVEALEGNINGYGNTVIATPSFATIEKEAEPPKQEPENKFESY